MLPLGFIQDQAVKKGNTASWTRFIVPSSPMERDGTVWGDLGAILSEPWRKGAGRSENFATVLQAPIGGLAGNAETAGRGHVGTWAGVHARLSGMQELPCLSSTV